MGLLFSPFSWKETLQEIEHHCFKIRCSLTCQCWSSSQQARPPAVQASQGNKAPHTQGGHPCVTMYSRHASSAQLHVPSLRCHLSESCYNLVVSEVAYSRPSKCTTARVQLSFTICFSLGAPHTQLPTVLVGRSENQHEVFCSRAVRSLILNTLNGAVTLLFPQERILRKLSHGYRLAFTFSLNHVSLPCQCPPSPSDE